MNTCFAVISYESFGWLVAASLVLVAIILIAEYIHNHPDDDPGPMD